MAIPQRFLDELVARSDIADVVGDYVQLTKRSGSNLFGLCPFHSEKTPSFSVSTDRQTFHCFGCGKGGGVITFIREIENLSFRDAVEVLAKRAGMELPEEEGNEELRSKRDRLLLLNRTAARYFYENLRRPDCRAAVEYIQKRGIAPKTVTRFGLGAAPDAWSDLADAMKKRGFSEQELLDAGLVKQGKKGGVYDVFRSRLIFPVIDVRGSVIGFSGRILGDGEPKYLNSPDTPVFLKSRNLFALNLAKKTQWKLLILVEGNVDVVSLHQAGFDCAVASLGTSLTQEQARLLKNHTEEVVVAYDADSAGQKATARAIPLLEAAGLTVRVLRVEGAKDPDEFIKARGPDAFANLLERSANRVDYQLQTLEGKYDLKNDDGRLQYLGEAVTLLSTLPDAIKRDVYAQRVAEKAGISTEAVKLEVKKAYKRRISADNKKQERQLLHPDTLAQPKERSLRYDNPASAAAEEGVIRLLVADPALAGGLALTRDDFTSPFLGSVYEDIQARFQNHGDISPQSLLAALTGEEAALLTSILQKPVSAANAGPALRDYIAKIRAERLKSAGGGPDLLAIQEQYKKKKGFGG